MKYIYKSEKGSVSVFLIIIFAVIFFLNAVLIDYARIITAKYQTENALKTAVRSVLSAYDTNLYINNGFFGIADDRGYDIYVDVLEKKLEVKPGYFNFTEVKLDLDNLYLDKKHELAYQAVFEKQILEEMKYKAPIDFTLDIIDEFTSFSLVMKEATNTTKVLNNIEDEYEKRNEYLSDTIDEQKNAVSLFNKKNPLNISAIMPFYNSYVSGIAELTLLSNYEVEGMNEEEKEEWLENKKATESMVEQSKENAINISNELANYYGSKVDKHINYLDLALKSLENAKEANEELKMTISSANEKAENSQYDMVNNNLLNDRGNEYEQKIIINNLKNLNKNITENEELALGEEYFVNMINDISTQKELYLEVSDKLDALSNQVELAFNGSGSYPSTMLNISVKDIEKNINNYKDYFADYNSIGNKILAQESFIYEMQNEIKDKCEDLRMKSDNSLKSINQSIDLLGTMNAQNEELSILTDALDKYIEFNNKQNLKSDGYILTNSTENLIDDTVFEVDNLFIELVDILENLRNKLYVGEYSFSRFNHFDFTIFNREDLKSESYDKLEGLMSISNQEIEYIIYGSDIIGGNIAAALRDIFIIRLAINLMEAFSQPAVLAATNPLLILAEATVYAITTTVADITQLMKGEEIFLAKKVKNIKFDYGDYLRLLFLIRGSEEAQMSRIQALIDYKYDKDLCNIYTYVEGNINTSIELWFIPGVMKAINYVGILDGQVEGNRYIISKTAVMSY